MSYIGRGLQAGAFRQLDDISSGFDGSDATHTMQVNSADVTVGDVNQILLSLGGVIQKPGTDFTVSGSVLTFTTAPAANTSFFAILLGSDNGGTVTPTDASVTGGKLAADIAITTTGNADFNGDLDVDGTTNLDVVDIDGAVNMATTALVTGVLTTTAATVFNGGFASNAASTITVTDNSDTLTLKSTDTDDDIGPNLRLYRAVTGADNDLLGTIDWAGQDDGSGLTDYVSIIGQIVDASNGSEDGKLILQVMNAGSLNQMLTISGPETVVNEGSKDHDFRVESDDNTHGLFLQGSTGDVYIGSTDGSIGSDSPGIKLFGSDDATHKGGMNVVTAGGNDPISLNRGQGDGTMISFRSAGTVEGSISISGTTTSYSAFTGSHWSRLADNSKPTILRGTVMESLDTMMNWYNLEFNNSNGHKQKILYALADGQSNGDTVTYNYNGTDVEATIVKEDDVKHVYSKISTTADSTRVYGLFHCWDDENGVNDMEVAQVGTYIIRVHKDVTVAAGDLLVSNGDGTAKLQDDDIIRSKTVAKVNSNVKVETYDDGSYTVPCTLHC